MSGSEISDGYTQHMFLSLYKRLTNSPSAITWMFSTPKYFFPFKCLFRYIFEDDGHIMLTNIAVYKGFKIYLRILRFTPSVFNKFSHLTMAVENLFFSGIAWKDWGLKLRASCRLRPTYFPICFVWWWEYFFCYIYIYSTNIPPIMIIHPLSVKFWDWVCKKYKIQPHS
jgi:hypothetical protein